MASEKIDLYKIYGDEYIAPKKPIFIRNLSARFLTITAKGIPGGDNFLARIESLYVMALTIRKEMKQSGLEYDLFVSEAQLWGTKKGTDFLAEPPDTWNSKILVRVPHLVDEDIRMTTIMNLMDQGQDPTISEVKLETIKEGLCIQLLQKGPIIDMTQSMEKVMTFAQAENVHPHTPYHQIYLTDPRKVAPDKMQTILRIPVR
jgi:hypothetical protein